MDLRDFERALKKAGFVYLRRTRHQALWGHPDGRKIGLPNAKGKTLDPRALRNLEAEWKRLQSSSVGQTKV